MQIKEDARNRAIYLKVEKITHETKRAIRQAYYRAGKQLKSHLSKKMLEKPKHGRTYYIRRGGKIRKHVASAPYEYPAQMTPTTGYRSTIDFLVSGSTRLEFGANKFYAKYLETGTKKMQARKPLQRSIEDNKQNIFSYFEQEIKKALNKNG